MNQISENAPKESVKHRLFYGAGCAFELTKWIIVLVIAITMIHFFIATIAVVDGVSMEPNFHTNQIVLVNRWNYNFGKPARGDAVILKFPGDPDHKKYIKRIIGLPGEHVKVAGGEVYINGQKINEPFLGQGIKTYKLDPTGVPLTNEVLDVTVKPDEYFIMGDNRPNSNDSRTWGTAGRRFLIGKAMFVIWPTQEIVPEVKF